MFALVAALALAWLLPAPAHAQGTGSGDCAAPDLAGRTQVWSGTMNVGTWVFGAFHYYGYFYWVAHHGSIPESKAFRYVNEYQVREVRLRLAPLFADTSLHGQLSLKLNAALSAEEVSGLRLHVCDETFALSAASRRSWFDIGVYSYVYSYEWFNTGLEWSAGDTRTLRLSVPATPDIYAPTVTSIKRQAPSASPTEADRVTWRVSFSEDVRNVDAADFAVSGVAATPAVAAVPGSASQYDVTVSGADLASLDGTVTLSFAAGQDIRDAAGNALAGTTPTGANDNRYVIDNTAPTVPSIERQTPSFSPTNADSVTWWVSFSEDVLNVDATDFELSGVAATLTVVPVPGPDFQYDVTASGADLASFDGTVTLSFATRWDIRDPAGNALVEILPTGWNLDSYAIDNTAPTVASIARQTPSVSPTDADRVTWRVTFSEDVRNVGTADFTVSGVAATLAVAAVTDSASQYDVTASGEELASLDGTVTLSFATDQDIEDAAGNALAATAPTGGNDNSYAIENTAGRGTAPVVSIGPSATPVTEGATASFALTRTGDAAAALTVEVSVSETGSVLDGAPPVSATFAEGSSKAVLNLATEDDETVEDASTVTVTLVAGDGYTVDGTAGSAEVVVNDDDASPVVTTASPVEVAENATAVAMLAATDADTATGDLSWSIPQGADGGADAGKFALTAAGALTFKATKDYESPDDANGDGDYEVTVRVTDGSNTVDAALVVRLTDVDEVAPKLSRASVDRDVLTLTFGEVLDADSVPPASSFAVTVTGKARTVNKARTVSKVSASGHTLTLTLSSAVRSGETVTVGYTVPTGEGAKPVQDTAGNPAAAFSNARVTNTMGKPPVVTTASPIEVAENATAVATLSATDADTAAGDLSWSIPEGADGGADAGKFALTAGGGLTFKAAKDYESPDDANGDGDYEVTVRVTDGSNTVDAALVVRLTDVGPAARYEDLPERHNGSGVFRFKLHFSQEPVGLSYKTVDGGLFEVTGASVTHARRLTKRSNLGWEVTVEPTRTGDIVIRLPARACGETNAICIDGEPLVQAATATVPGPTSSSLPVVSIAPSSTPVTEGTAAAFTLSRTGVTEAALTVDVSVTESGAAVSGTLPGSVTFAEGSSTATLSVATEDDEVVEEASTVTAAVSSGTGYTMDGTAGSAEVVVNDDDASPVVTTASPVEVAENATAVATLAATDADTATGDLSWSIPQGADGGADAGKFALTAGGALTFRAAEDYESPDDANADGDYEVTVRVTDGSNAVDAALVVRLTDVDEEAPTLSDASVDGNELTLRFGETLDEDSVPPASSFAVTVAGSARTVESLAVSGSAVTLTLSSAVASGETVTVGYTVPTGAGAEPLEDTVGNEAAAFANAAVTNETGTPPVVSIAASTTPVTEGTAAAYTLTRTGDTAEALTVTVSVTESAGVLDGDAPAEATFEAGSADTVLSVATEDDEVAEDSSTVTAAVSSGTGYTVDGTSGSAEVVVEDDDAAPVVATESPIEAAENATTVATLAATDEDTDTAVLAWSIPEGEAGGADAGMFALTAGGALTFKAAQDYEGPDDADNDGDYEVTVRVTDGANAVDAALVVRLADVDDTAPTLSNASVDGNELTLTFSEALDEDSTPASSAFAVTAAGSLRTVDAVAVSGSAVTLTLSSAVSSGDTVTAGYTVPTGADAQPVRDVAGNAAATFAGAEVTNLTVALPVVSIAPSTAPVTEGTAVAFVLERTGSTDAALTVTVSVSQAGSVLDGTPPSSATFSAGSAEVRLSVATVNDGTDEADALVLASIVAGEGYEVDGASAAVDVFDDDATPPAAETLWSTTMTWTDIGGGWFGGFADTFETPGWTEGGRSFRIWYIAYDAGARELHVVHDGSGGHIAAPGELTLHIGGLSVGPGGAVSAFARGATGTVAGVGSRWGVGEQVTVRLTRATGDAAPAGPGVSVADAQVNESSGAPLRFRVTLAEPAQSAVSVRYRTSDGTARAGEDYVAATGVVRFEADQSEKTVEVAVLPDEHDEGSETMTLTLSAPFGAAVADATATGTIVNTGHIPKAWIARFGRTVAEQAVEAVEARFDAPRAAGLAGTFAGRPLSGMVPDDRQAYGTRRSLGAFGAWLDATDEGHGTHGLDTRTLTASEALSNSSFSLTEGTAESGFASFWGRGAVTRFDGGEDELTLDGEVTSLTLGADFSRDALLGGLMLSHSRGEGGYRSGTDGGGTVETTLTSLFPYARYVLSERVSAWGMAGYGEGTLTVTPEGQAPLRPDTDLLMGALGVRGVLLDGGTDSATLSAKSDAFAVRTSADAVSGGMGNLEATRADVTRVRFALEGSRPFALGADAVLTPSLELGVRRDGGDAETGFGTDIGAGVAFSAPSQGLSAELRARGLLTHEADGLRERSLSGSLSFDPTPHTERGLSLSLTQSVGAHGAGGTDALLERSTLAGLGAEEDGGLSARRFDARIGYGLGVLDGRYTATPELGLGLSDSARELRLGWRLTARASAGPGFELGLEGTRRDAADDGGAPEHAVGLNLTARW